MEFLSNINEKEFKNELIKNNKTKEFDDFYLKFNNNTFNNNNTTTTNTTTTNTTTTNNNNQINNNQTTTHYVHKNLQKTIQKYKQFQQYKINKILLKIKNQQIKLPIYSNKTDFLNLIFNKNVILVAGNWFFIGFINYYYYY